MVDIPPAYTVASTVVVLFVLSRFLRRSRALIHGPPRDSIIAGNLGQLFAPADGMVYHEKFTKEYGNAFEIYGLFGEKQFFVSDTQAISAILNNPDTFTETNAFLGVGRTIFGTGLFATTGQVHKKLRKSLQPFFATRHIRDLLTVFRPIASQLQTGLAAEVRTRSSGSSAAGKAPEAEIDVLDWISRTALDLVGLGGLGHEFGAVKSAKNKYSEYAKRLLPTLAEISLITPFLHILQKIGSKPFQRSVVSLVPIPSVQNFKAVIDVMHDTALEIFEEKKATVSKVVRESGGGGDDYSEELKDVMSLTLAANMQNPRLTDTELVAQISTLIFAALDTTSGALVRTLQMLSLHPSIQSRLRQEIVDAYRANGGQDLDYDTLDNLPYLDAVCAEALRLHPPLSFISRTSQSPFVLPLATPVPSSNAKDTTLVTALPLPAGTTIYISIQGVNRDPNIWGPDADEFRPERWLESDEKSREWDGKGREKAKREVPSLWSSILSFSTGPTGCIGFKFALTEMKLVLSTLLPLFSFKPSSTPVEWHLSLTQAPHVATEDGSRVTGLPLIVQVIE